MKKKFIKAVFYGVSAALFLSAGFLIISWYGFQKERQDAVFGVTFSTVMARQLGFEPKEIFNAIADYLKVRKVRLPVYWSDIESKRGEFNFAEYDYFFDKSEAEGIKLLVVLGKKLPRWPECHIPTWAYVLSEKERQEALENMIKKVVEHYRSSTSIEAWQIENEPFFKYGVFCAEDVLSAESIEREVKIIKSLDTRPVVISDSGELGFWFKAAKYGDILGITMYRQIWNKYLGIVKYPMGPGYFRLKAELLGRFFGPKQVTVVELQAEPWSPGLLPGTDFALQQKLMNVEQLRSVVSYARRTGFDTFYLWGAEWWYWMKERQNGPAIWNEAKKLF